MSDLIQFDNRELEDWGYWETTPYGGGTGASTPGIGLVTAARIVMPNGMIRQADRVQYICSAANGNVQIAVFRPTTKFGVTVDVVGQTASTAAVGASAIHDIALESPIDVYSGDYIGLISNHASFQYRVVSIWPNNPSKKARSIVKSGLSIPLSGQIVFAAGDTTPWLAIYRSSN